LNLKELSDIITPRKNEEIRKSIREKNKNNEFKYLNDKIMDCFVKILQIELNYINKFAIISEKLRFSRDVTSYELFSLIDKKNEKYLNQSNVLNFLNKIGDNNYSNLEANDILFRLCKLDRVNISYEDFQDILTPIKILSYENQVSDQNNQNRIFDYDNKNNDKLENKIEKINQGDFFGI